MLEFLKYFVHVVGSSPMSFLAQSFPFLRRLLLAVTSRFRRTGGGRQTVNQLSNGSNSCNIATGDRCDIRIG